MDAPAKEVVRRYTGSRFGNRGPLPTMEEIRRQLGWGLVRPARVSLQLAPRDVKALDGK